MCSRLLFPLHFPLAEVSPSLHEKMAVILRLQGLDEKADADDIRSFFSSLHIPNGGIYIVGGSLREAFIAFNTEREAQLAMNQTGEAIKGSKVILKKSSMAQLEHRLKTLIKTKKSRPTALKPQLQSDSNFTSSHHEDNTAVPSARSPNLDTANSPHTNNQESCASTSNGLASNEGSIDSGTAFLLGICTVLQGLQSSQTTTPGVDFYTSKRTLPEEVVETPEETKPGYVRLFGMPESTTKEDICRFFKGLIVQEAIVNVKLGPSRGCLVMFAKMRDAFEALRFNKQLLGSSCVEVRGADEKLWLSSLEECKNAFEALVRNDPRQHAKESANDDSVLQLKRKTAKQFPLKPSKRHKIDALSNTLIPPSKDYIVMVSNLPCTMTKTEIKELFQCSNLSHRNVLHLLDKNGSRTDKAFLMFDSVEDFDYAMNLSGCHVGSDAIEVSSITRTDMNEMLSKDRPKYRRPGLTDPRTCSRREFDLATPEELPNKNLDEAVQMCLFVRNMPADVQKSQIKSLFYQFKVRTGDITLLHDSEGNGIGEAVIKFRSEKLASLAQRIHGDDFLGTNVLITRISTTQMNDILARF